MLVSCLCVAVNSFRFQVGIIRRDCCLMRCDAPIASVLEYKEPLRKRSTKPSLAAYQLLIYELSKLQCASCSPVVLAALFSQRLLELYVIGKHKPCQCCCANRIKLTKLGSPVDSNVQYVYRGPDALPNRHEKKL